MLSNNFDFRRIKNKIMEIDATKYWGDNFDVRFFLISNLRKIKNKRILDVGGGIGIISSELSLENFRVNLDLSFQDLLLCQKNYPTINNVCASMKSLPFKENSFDVVICSHLLEVAKNIDIKNNLTRTYSEKYPTVEKTLIEISKVLKNLSKLYLTTPNNKYYKSTKLDYYELKKSLSNYFKIYKLFFFNTYPRLNQKNRKLNMANAIPKLLSKIKDHESVLRSLLKEDKGENRNSVSFYVEAVKSNNREKSGLMNNLTENFGK